MYTNSRLARVLLELLDTAKPVNHRPATGIVPRSFPRPDAPQGMISSTVPLTMTWISLSPLSTATAGSDSMAVAAILA